jgi:hypothetical protein
MYIMGNKLDKLPVPNWIIFGGTIAAAITAMMVLYNSLGLPAPLTEQSPAMMEIQANVETHSSDLKAVEERVDANRVEQLSRYVREDKRELYEVKKRLKEEPDNNDLVQQQIILEETLEELEGEKDVLRKKGDD